MIRITPIQPHRHIEQAEAVKRLFTAAELRFHAIAINAILQRMGAQP